MTAEEALVDIEAAAGPIVGTEETDLAPLGRILNALRSAWGI